MLGSPPTFDFTVTPPAGSGLGEPIVSGLTLSGDATFDIQLPDAVTFSGRVLLDDGTPVSAGTVFLSRGNIFNRGQIDSTGNFSLSVTPDIYTVGIFNAHLIGTDNAKTEWGGNGGTIDLTGVDVNGAPINVSEDLILAVVDVTVNAVTSNGSSVPNSTVRLSGSGLSPVSPSKS